MSKLAHSNQETMDKIERDARERDERGEPDPERKAYAASSAFTPEERARYGIPNYDLRQERSR